MRCYGRNARTLSGKFSCYCTDWDGYSRPMPKMMEMDRAVTTNLWNYSSYNQPLYERFDHQYHAHHHHHHHQLHRYQNDQIPSPMITPGFKSSPPYCSLNYPTQPPSVAADSVSGAWKMVRGGVTSNQPQWPTAIRENVLGRATDAVSAMAVAAQRSFVPYHGIGA